MGSNEKVFPVQRKAAESDNLGAHPGESFKDMWDIGSIEQAVRIAKEAHDLPPFRLDKVEIHPSGFCNLSCSFCYGQKLSPEADKRENLPLGAVSNVLRNIRDEMSEEDPLIVLAGMYSEPLLHPEIGEIAIQLGENHFRFGIYTNGLQMNRELMEKIVDSSNATTTQKKTKLRLF